MENTALHKELDTRSPIEFYGKSKDKNWVLGLTLLATAPLCTCVLGQILNSFAVRVDPERFLQLVFLWPCASRPCRS